MSLLHHSSKCLSSRPGPAPDSGHLQLHILGGSGDGPSDWVPATHAGNVGWVLSS